MLFKAKKKEKGFVLLAVLFFTQIIAELSLSSFEAVFLSRKIVSDQREQRLLFNAAEKRLQALERMEESSLARCRLPQVAGELMQLPLSWFRQNTCFGVFGLFEYYYFVEDLGLNKEVKGNSAHFYRFSLKLTKTHDAYRKVVLQSTQLRETDADTAKVTFQRQSWNELR